MLVGPRGHLVTAFGRCVKPPAEHLPKPSERDSWRQKYLIRSNCQFLLQLWNIITANHPFSLRLSAGSLIFGYVGQQTRVKSITGIQVCLSTVQLTFSIQRQEECISIGGTPWMFSSYTDTKLPLQWPIFVIFMKVGIVQCVNLWLLFCVKPTLPNRWGLSLKYEALVIHLYDSVIDGES